MPHSLFMLKFYKIGKKYLTRLYGLAEYSEKCGCGLENSGLAEEEYAGQNAGELHYFGYENNYVDKTDQ